MRLKITESLIQICEGFGMSFKRNGQEMYALCPFHDDKKKPSFRVDEVKNEWFCDVCATGGGPAQFVAKKQGRNATDVWKEMIDKQNGKTRTVTANGHNGNKFNVVATYDYTDAMGNLLYQVCRLDPKDFRQRTMGKDGKWVWKLEGVERVLYRLPEILSDKTELVWVLEGEKDVETLREIRQVATTNVGGAKKWSDAYSQTLKGKEVIVCGDNDNAGIEHTKKIIESVEPFAKKVRHVKIPLVPTEEQEKLSGLKEFKDVSDYRKGFETKEKFAAAMMELCLSSPVIGVLSLPIKSIYELEQEKIDEVRNSKNVLVDLGRWLPGLGVGRGVRPLVAGEMVAFIGDTGTLKTYVLQQIAIKCKVTTLLFEMELPGSLTLERFVGLSLNRPGKEIDDGYKEEKRFELGDLAHIYTCSKSGLTAAMIESLILKSELKIGVRPSLVEIDYVQLATGEGRSKYERISSFIEGMKVVAKNTGTVIIVVSQIARDKKSPEVTIHDGKDSGSIENSSGLVIGMWRHAKERNNLIFKVLKNTKGIPGDEIVCEIEDGTMWIKEKGKIDG